MQSSVQPTFPDEEEVRSSGFTVTHAHEADLTGLTPTWREVLFGDTARDVAVYLRVRLCLTRLVARVTTVVGLAFLLTTLLNPPLDTEAGSKHATLLILTGLLMTGCFPLFHVLSQKRRFCCARHAVVGSMTLATTSLCLVVGTEHVPVQSWYLLIMVVVLLAYPPGPKTVLSAAALGAAYVALSVWPVHRDCELYHTRTATAVTQVAMTMSMLGAVHQMHRLFTMMRRREDRFKRSLESSKQKERQSQARMAFLTMMSHEIRTPLNAVIGLSDLLTSALESTEHEDMARTVSSSSQALLTVVNDVLDFSRVDAGHVSLVPSDTDLDDVVDATVQALYSSAAAKGVELHADVRLPYPFRVMVDSVRLRQVLTNLTGNAIKFTDRGHVLLTVQLLADEDGVVEFSVSDTGCGIEESALATIFEPFTQAEGGTARRFDGTGLGLAIAQRIVKAMDGRLGVESTVGVGTRFWVRLALPALTSTDNRMDEVHHHLHLLRRASAETEGGAVGVALQCQSGLLHATLKRGLEAVGGAVVVASGEAPVAITLVEVSPQQPPGAVLREITLGRQWRGKVVAVASPFQELNASIAGGLPRLALPVRRHALAQLLTSVRSKAVTPATPVARLTQRLENSHRGLRVLVADDNTVNRKVVARMLDKLGCESLLVENGLQAVEHVEAGLAPRPEVVLMDCHMPVMDGFEAARVISGSRPELPIIALTADAFEDARARALRCGMVEVVTKPVLLSELAAALSRSRMPKAASWHGS